MPLAKTKVALAALPLVLLAAAALVPTARAATFGPRGGIKAFGARHNNNNNNNNNNTLSAPTIECEGSTVSTVTIEICAGDTGAPNGFELLYADLETFIDEGGFPCNTNNGEDEFCRVTILDSFNQGECTTLTIGTETDTPGVTFNPQSCNDELPCNTDFVFRAFALGGQGFNQSAPSETTTCSTSPCNVQPTTCFTTTPNEGDLCGLCRPSCGVISRSVVCSFYEVDSPDCRISARGGGGNVCASTDVCCVVNPPDNVAPDAGGVCAPPSLLFAELQGEGEEEVEPFAEAEGEGEGEEEFEPFDEPEEIAEEIVIDEEMMIDEEAVPEEETVPVVTTKAARKP